MRTPELVRALAEVLAHEINTPLGYVKSNLAFVRGQLAQGEGGAPSDPAEVEAALAEAALGIERIRRVVVELGHFARDSRDTRDDLGARDGASPVGRPPPGGRHDDEQRGD